MNDPQRLNAFPSLLSIFTVLFSLHFHSNCIPHRPPHSNCPLTTLQPQLFPCFRLFYACIFLNFQTSYFFLSPISIIVHYDLWEISHLWFRKIFKNIIRYIQMFDCNRFAPYFASYLSSPVYSPIWSCDQKVGPMNCFFKQIVFPIFDNTCIISGPWWNGNKNEYILEIT